MCPVFHRGRTSTAVPLLAGACAYTTPSLGGAFAFSMLILPSDTWWGHGSANMLFAGAAANDPSSGGGAFTFDMTNLPLDWYWSIGSANKNISIPKLV